MKKFLFVFIFAAFAFAFQAVSIQAQTNFRIVSLTVNNTKQITSDGITGDDGSSFALSSQSVFFTGDTQTGRFNLSDLTGGANLGSQVRYTALISDLQTGKIFTLATSATAPMTSDAVVTATHIIELDAATGALTTNAFALSQSITINSGSGFFSGAGRVVIDNKNSVYAINPYSGAVSTLGNTPSNITPTLSESGARFWGVAEFFGGVNYLVYHRNGYDIVRTRLTDSDTSVLLNVPGSLDMAQFSVSPFLQRWYYHAEGGVFTYVGNAEGIGYADATIELTNPNAPIVSNQFGDKTITEDQATPIVLDADVRDNFSDPDNDPLSFSASSNNANVGVAVVGNELRVTSLGANFDGTAVITVSATDNQDGSAAATFNLSVQSVNDLPVVSNPLIDQNIYSSSTLPLLLDANLDDNFSDIEGALIFTAASDNANVTVATSGTRGRVLQLTALAANFTGTANITVTATDSNNATVSDVFVLKVLAAPTAANDLFKIASLGTTGSKVIEVQNTAGDDGSALVVGANGVLFTGDTTTARYSADDLTGFVSYGARHTTLTSDLRTGKIYSFGTSATQAITCDYVSACNGKVTATHLLELNQTSGAIIGAVTLSSSVTIAPNSGLFSGFRRILVSGDTGVSAIDPTTGAVVNLGATPAMNAALAETDSRFWGVAEFDGTNTFLVYRQNGNDIVRTRLGDGATTVVQSFTNLGQIAQFGVSLTRNRWYYHSENGTQFNNGTAYEEALGYADATFTFAASSNNAPTVTTPLADATISEDQLTPIILDADLTNNFSDADGDVLTFQAETDNQAVAVSTANNRLTVTSLAPNFTGTVNITVTARDGRGGIVADSLVLTVNPADNDAPVNTVPGTQTIFQNQSLFFANANGISVSDPDAGTNPVRTTLSVTTGTLTLNSVPNGLTVTGNGTNNVVLTGTIANINAALYYLKFTPPPTFTGNATLSVSTNDQGNSGPGTAQTDTDLVQIIVVADADGDGVGDASDVCPNTPSGESVNQYGCSASQSAGNLSNLKVWLTGDGEAIDFSESGNGGTLNGGAGYALGKVGQAFKFDGSTGYASVPDSNSVELTNQFTIEGWIKTGNVSDTRQIVSKFGGSGNAAFQFGVAAGNALRLEVSENGTNGFELTTAPGVFYSNEWNHVAATFRDGAVIVYVNGNVVANGNLPVTTANYTGNAPLNVGRSGFGSQYFNGLIDEISLYQRQLSQDEIRGIISVGARGKLKQRATSTGFNVQTKIASATIGFFQVSNAGQSTETPLDGSTLPTLPIGSNSNALFLDVSTTANYSESPTVCFNVPSFTPTQLANSRVFHLENGAWVNRTGAVNGTQICTSGLTSLSPFAIAALPPTAAAATISGKVLLDRKISLNPLNGKNILGGGKNATKVVLTGGDGITRTVKVDANGNFRFDEVPVGFVYVINIVDRTQTFNPQVITLTENVEGLEFAPVQ